MGLRHDDFESWNDVWAREPEGGHAEEAYELRDDHELLDAPRSRSEAKAEYADGSTIGTPLQPCSCTTCPECRADWLHEEAAERLRRQQIRSFRGLRGLLLPLLETSRVWLIVIGTGVGVGVVGAWLDILVRWFSDLREGRCAYGFFYNQVACCSGLDRA